MSLMDEAMENFIIINVAKVDDGIGGYKTVYSDGATIKGALEFLNSIEGRKAEAQGVTSIYNLYTKKNIILENHEILRRVGDGKIFRITSDGDDDYTPNSASLNLRMVSVEEWELKHD